MDMTVNMAWEGVEAMWEVTYEDGSIEQFKDMEIELVCAYIDEKKNVIKIERIQKPTDE